MVGTKAGAAKAKATNYARHGNDFYKKIGAMGGSKSHGGGFTYNHALARVAGAKGGRRSRRNGVDHKAMIENNAEMVIQLLGYGVKKAEIARLVGVPVQSLYNYLNKERTK